MATLSTENFAAALCFSKPVSKFQTPKLLVHFAVEAAPLEAANDKPGHHLSEHGHFTHPPKTEDSPETHVRQGFPGGRRYGRTVFTYEV
ncbi:hypothetical protein [Caballeronia sordidicola]|uniref:hypothetical protein n=1 Tax=Caballeronia sordidicola TaxID=196367 RepID=UPI001C501284|nr:hypothetical protein [Caballeronia sordidicola]